MKRGRFIVIDGIDGSGKGMQVALLKRALGKNTVFTHEPGGTPKAEKIRKLLLERTEETPAPLADFLLFWAARADHVEKVVLPALRAGKNVITDRFDSSTFAFQICAEQAPKLKPLFEALRNIVMQKCIPDAYIILDMPADIAKKRRGEDPAGKAVFFDEKPIAYHQRARAGFKKFARGRRLLPSAPPALSYLRDSKVFFVNANRTPEEVHEDIMSIVNEQSVS